MLSNLLINRADLPMEIKLNYMYVFIAFSSPSFSIFLALALPFPLINTSKTTGHISRYWSRKTLGEKHTTKHGKKLKKRKKNNPAILSGNIL